MQACNKIECTHHRTPAPTQITTSLALEYYFINPLNNQHGFTVSHINPDLAFLVAGADTFTLIAVNPNSDEIQGGRKGGVSSLAPLQDDDDTMTGCASGAGYADSASAKMVTRIIILFET